MMTIRHDSLGRVLGGLHGVPEHTDLAGHILENIAGRSPEEMAELALWENLPRVTAWLGLVLVLLVTLNVFVVREDRPGASVLDADALVSTEAETLPDEELVLAALFLDGTTP